MNTMQCSNLLIEFFAKNECFQLEKDFKTIVLLTDNEDADKACILTALDILEESKFLRKKTVNDKEYWILTQPLMMQNQTIEVPLMLCAEIAEIINQIPPATEGRTNCLNISSQDIFHLVRIIKGDIDEMDDE